MLLIHNMFIWLEPAIKLVILWWFYGDFMVILWWFYGDLINGDLMMI